MLSMDNVQLERRKDYIQWLSPCLRPATGLCSDHNHLRITRIIKSLRLLAGDAEANALKTKILDIVGFSGSSISARSMGSWVSA